MGDLSAEVSDAIEQAKWDGIRKAKDADYWLETASFRQIVESRVARRSLLDFGDVVYAPCRQSGKKLAEAFIEIDRVREDLRACGLTGADARLRDAITKIRYELRNG